MPSINRHCCKDNERNHANTGFVQNEHRARSKSKGDKGSSHHGGSSQLAGRICKLVGACYASWMLHGTKDHSLSGQ
eukprot:12901630-Prorocentrum_lima.AAC.1